MRWVLALLLASSVVMTSITETSANEYIKEMWQIAERLACPVCGGQSIKDSNAPLARQMRTLIIEKLKNGEDREAIVEFFVDRYGEGVRLDPMKAGFQLAVWAGPIAIVSFALLIVGRVLWRNRLGRTRYPVCDDHILPVDNGASDGLCNK